MTESVNESKHLWATARKDQTHLTDEQAAFRMEKGLKRAFSMPENPKIRKTPSERKPSKPSGSSPS